MSIFQTNNLSKLKRSNYRHVVLRHCYVEYLSNIFKEIYNGKIILKHLRKVKVILIFFFLGKNKDILETTNKF